MPLSSVPAIAARSVDRRDRSSSTTSAIGRIVQPSMLWPCASCATPSCTPIVAIASVVDRRRHGQDRRSFAAAVKPPARLLRAFIGVTIYRLCGAFILSMNQCLRPVVRLRAVGRLSRLAGPERPDRRAQDRHARGACCWRGEGHQAEGVGRGRSAGLEAACSKTISRSQQG